MRLANGSERRHFLVPHVDPFDSAVTTQRVGDAVETVADDAINSLDARRAKNLDELIRHIFCHRIRSSNRAKAAGPRA
jgi:hypothetical protein